MELALDFDAITLEEAEEIENLTGIAIDELGATGKPKAKVIRALCFITMRRTNPALTWEETANLRVSEITFGDADPKEHGSDASRPSA